MTHPSRVTVDEQVCAATEFCIRVAPDLFELSDETGKAVVKAPLTNATLEEKAEEAELTCPTGAIRLIPSEGP